MIDDQRIARVLAWLMRNEGVTPEMIERAVESAVDMHISDTVTLTGDDLHAYRRAFVYEQVHLLENSS